MNIEDLKKRYFKLCHAMQSGVSGIMIYDSHPTEPKHLRVGVNSSLITNTAIVTILLRKGIITEQEYWEQLVESTFDEVERYEDELSKKLGKKVTLI